MWPAQRSNLDYCPLGCYAPVTANSGLRPETRGFCNLWRSGMAVPTPQGEYSGEPARRQRQGQSG